MIHCFSLEIMRSPSSDKYSIVQTIGDKNIGRIVMKVIKKSKENAGLHTSFKELENCDCPYVVRYIKCREDENKYRV